MRPRPKLPFTSLFGKRERKKLEIPVNDAFAANKSGFSTVLLVRSQPYFYIETKFTVLIFVFCF